MISDYATERGQPFDINQVLDEIIDQIGILYINEKGEISFKHQSFQEYFTAFEIFHHRPADRKIFIENFNDLWWQNVAIFYAGMSKDAPTLIEEILDKSEPKNLSEFITNTGGIGKLLQALYNTPIPQRKKGILRGLQNTNKALKYIIETDNKETEFWKYFSKYSLMQIFGGWFKVNNWSITLNEPLTQQFNELIPQIEEELTKQERFELEYELFLMASILASDDFLKFESLRQLVEKSKLSDLELVAIIDTHYKVLSKRIPKTYRDNDDLKKIEKKMRKRITALPQFAETVNAPLREFKKENNEKLTDKAK